MSAGINIFGRKIQTLFHRFSGWVPGGRLQCPHYQFVDRAPSLWIIRCCRLPPQLWRAGTFVGAVLGKAILVPLSEAFGNLGGLRIAFYS